MGQLKNLKEDVGHLRSLVIRLQIMDSPDEKDRVLVGEFPPRYESPIAKFVHCWPLCSNHNILILPPPSECRPPHVCSTCVIADPCLRSLTRSAPSVLSSFVSTFTLHKRPRRLLTSSRSSMSACSPPWQCSSVSYCRVSQFSHWPSNALPVPHFSPFFLTHRLPRRCVR